MHSALVLALAAFFAFVAFPAVSANGIPVSTINWSAIYDDQSASLDNVECSNGPNGLETKGFTTIGSLPTWPYVGGVSGIKGWDSPACGTCWEIRTENKSIKILAMDTSSVGVTLSKSAFIDLAGDDVSDALAAGSFKAVAEALNPSSCGL